MNSQKNFEVIANVDAQLNIIGVPSYSELVKLLNDVARHGLNFDVGSAYIRRSYIDTQTELWGRIKQVNEAVACPAVHR